MATASVSPWDDEHTLILEAVLLAQPGNDLFLERLRKPRDTVGLQLQGNVASTHVNLRGGRLRETSADNPLAFRKPVEWLEECITVNHDRLLN